MSLRGVLLSQHGYQKHFVQLEPFELFLSFIQVLFLLQLLLLYCSVEVGVSVPNLSFQTQFSGRLPCDNLRTSLCFRLRVFALPFSTCLVKTAFEVCTERPAAPLDARWYSGTREDLNTFCFINSVNSSDASCGPLSKTISSGIK